MTRLERFSGPGIPDGFYWFNEPSQFVCGDGIAIHTDKETDFWQRTHYGFQRDNGHCLFTRIEGDFSMTTHVTFTPTAQYDQCGLMVRADGDHWIKFSTEYENEAISRLGSVATNHGYSDWASQDVLSGITARWYRIRREGDDFILESAEDGEDWTQTRVAHLHNAPKTVEAGVYACSPVGEGFVCRFSRVELL